MEGAQSPGRKAPVNVSVRRELIGRARALGINVSNVLEDALSEAIAAAERDAWLSENAGAIAEYNAQVEERGVFSDHWRRF